VLNAHESPALLNGGTADHAHVLCLLARTNTLADVIAETKRSSSLWIKTKGNAYKDFYWQGGYGAFSVSHSNVKRVCDYIANQEEHHQKRGFQDELRAFFRKHGVKFDERYVWD
jgi:hypothetical protein